MQSRNTQTPIEQALEQARAVLREYDLPEAEQRYQQIRQSAFGNAVAWHNLAEMLYQQGKLILAERLCRHALTMENSAAFHTTLGNILLEQQQREEARNEFEKALAINPQYAPAHYDLGLLSYNQGDLPLALEHYRRAIAANPQHTEALNNIGFVLMQQGEQQQALSHFEHAIKIHPEFSDYRYNMGIIYRDQQQPDKAESCFRKCLKYSPDDPDAHFQLGKLLQDAGALPEAKEHYEQALNANPDFAEVHFPLAELLLNLAKYPEAEEHYYQAMEHAVLQPEIINGYGRSLMAQDKNDEALTQFRRVLALGGMYDIANYNMGIAYEKLNEYAKAKACFKQSLAINPDYVEAYLHLGILHLKLGEMDEARRCLLHCLEQDPNDAFGVKLLLAATGESLPEKASELQMKNLYATRAAWWDQENYLGYELVAKALERFAPHRPMDICDAGCGTGLVGQKIRPLARLLHGIDFSPAMLAKAKEKNIYDQLFEGDLVAQLERTPEAYDAITCAATLLHFSDLGQAFAAAAHALRGNGLFILTLFPNDADDNTVTLAPIIGGYAESGCFAHGRNYIRHTAAAYDFTVLQLDTEIHEYAKDTPVMGLIVTLQRKPR